MRTLSAASFPSITGGNPRNALKRRKALSTHSRWSTPFSRSWGNILSMSTAICRKTKPESSVSGPHPATANASFIRKHLAQWGAGISHSTSGSMICLSSSSISGRRGKDCRKVSGVRTASSQKERSCWWRTMMHVSARSSQSSLRKGPMLQSWWGKNMIGWKISSSRGLFWPTTLKS